MRILLFGDGRGSPRPWRRDLRRRLTILLAAALLCSTPALAWSPAANAAGWSVTLTPASSAVWPGQSVNLRATANQSVTGTPYAIQIWLDSPGPPVRVALCSTGTTCSYPATSSTTSYVDRRRYIALVAPPSTVWNGLYAPGSVAGSYWATVEWQQVSITNFYAGQSQLTPGGSTTLYLYTDKDLGPSPYYAVIYDETAAQVVRRCGAGTACTQAVSQPTEGTHHYRSYLEDARTSSVYVYAPALPPSPADISWSSAGLFVNTTATTNTLVARTNQDVGPTPYYILIMKSDGTLAATCGTGATCTAVPLDGWYAAFVAPYGTTLPPAGTVASSHWSYLYSPAPPPH